MLPLQFLILRGTVLNGVSGRQRAIFPVNDRMGVEGPKMQRNCW
jgi:hypothetical protein